MESFKICELTFTYPRQTKKVLDCLDFSIESGEFITLVGPSGSGKSTLLRHFKTVLAPHGDLSGEIFFEGRLLSEIDQREQSARIGFVFQNPDNQIVTDKVWHELSFGLESLGYDTSIIRERVAEMSSFFGIQTWFDKDVSELSGGQKQLLNLASIMAMQPSVLILDEPTSQLDPIAAADFLANVGKINRELGTTIIMTEHRLEEVFPISDRVLVLDEGRLICEGNPHEVGEALKKKRHSMFLSMPAPMRIYAAVPNDLVCPITVRDGRLWLNEFAEGHTLCDIPDEVRKRKEESPDGCPPAVELSDVWFKYEKDQPDVLKGLSIKVSKGEFLAILGGNGTGKTTMLSLISGINKPYRGKVMLDGRELSKKEDWLFDCFMGVLPQNPQALFVKKTVREDLWEMLRNRQISNEEKERKLTLMSRLCHLDDLISRHPYDLSGGEQQRVALAKVLLLKPKVLLLDEPTKGLDAEFKQIFAGILESLLCTGVTIIMVSHDIEFCSKYAHRCAMFFDGQIITDGSPRMFFSGNSFYTTSTNRMARHLLPEAVIEEDVIIACGGEVPPSQKLPADEDDVHLQGNFRREDNSKKTLPVWRRVIACAAGAVSLGATCLALFEPNIPWLINNNHMELYVILLVSALIMALSISRRGDRSIEDKKIWAGRNKLSKRTILATVMILFAIPLTIYIGNFYFGDRKYFFISLLIIVETMLPFIIIFEGRKPQARELIIITVLCALGVAGRAAFFMMPQFKPVTALVIIAGVAFGGEAGFLVGAITMITSNIMFGQGSWTPWQMFAMGIIGFLSGVLFRKGVLHRSRLSLSIFGGLAAIVIYGGLMNPASIIMYYSNPTWPMFLSAYLMGFPFDLVHALATVIFLWFISQPMLEKLDRIKVKYGLME